jgi:hypothetical protein
MHTANPLKTVQIKVEIERSKRSGTDQEIDSLVDKIRFRPDLKNPTSPVVSNYHSVGSDNTWKSGGRRFPNQTPIGGVIQVVITLIVTDPNSFHGKTSVI